MKKCQNCGKEMADDAKKCPHCESWIPIVQKKKDFEKYRTASIWGIFLFGLLSNIAFYQTGYNSMTGEFYWRVAVRSAYAWVFPSLDVLSFIAHWYLDSKLYTINKRVKGKLANSLQDE